METEKMIRELKRVEEIHKHDKVFTGQLNVAQMAHDTRKRLEELKPYEDTGLTPEQIMELKERDTAKAPTKDTDSGVRYTDDYICPNCGKHFTGTGIAEFCYHCGQRLKWED
ncbi:hypothetical protein H6A32_13160 [Drancourtella massiliensis]|uniref:Zinc ribbon domain-containing protein n=1 Tax=Drancourtella massiliensis TaxID=1632013 RepID=A0ABS2EJS9_9FIRM|nr:hypothetical protein [Drancourtella massiliensis]MBM6745233.1 hypothetical protein [Drancourtella massiliensis]